MADSVERIILQSDWEHSLSESCGKAWITYKKGDRPGRHGELESNGLSSEGLPYVVSSDGFSVDKVDKKRISVTYAKNDVKLTRKFNAAQITYSTIHNLKKKVLSLDVTTGGLGVSSDSEGLLRVWETRTGEVRRELTGHYGDVYCCRFFPSGIVILSGGADMQLKIWSAETGQCATTLLGHKGGILDTAIIDRGRNVLSCSRDGSVKLWDVGQQSCLTSFNECGGIVNSCCIGQPDNLYNLGIPDLPTGEREIGTEGKMLLVACENSMLQGYGLQSRKKVFELDCHSAVNCCCFLSNINVVCGTQDGHITISDMRNMSVPLKEWKESRSAILSLLPYKQGVFIATGDGSCYYVNEQYDTEVELTGSDCDPIYNTSCDDNHIYTACRDGNIRRYNLNHL
ncbi:hypothetical protein LOTGIDRAFT_232701 [Lottia gigantea]|uniref:Uncharacterized protein n=1 Tax=Lottia gigantea TaxID=225164 RepID=V4ADP7_LOTGI|nr:hypothetical protein LOTGIDRAFT_232701 [Lottia gigantea]ESO93250.1 hypothetical protein LOTGIDRAFT_232701 [Lottia gigantea]